MSESLTAARVLSIRGVLWLMVAGWLIGFSAQGYSADGQTNKIAKSYRIGTGDLLSINVFGEPDLRLDKVRVTANGTISFPLLGQVPASGNTAEELETVLVSSLLDGYLKNPKVTVTILRYRQYFVRGEVKRPGGFNYQDGLTVEMAIALAGGFTQRASKRKLSVVRDNDPENKSRRIKLSTPVQPGDVITVGESWL